MSDTISASPVLDRFAALRKAQEALSAIDKGEVPVVVAPSASDVKKPPRVFKARAAAPAAAAQPVMAGAVVSKPYDPSTAPVEPARFSPRLVPSKDTGRSFQELKLAHQKVGRDVSRQEGDAPVAAGAQAVAVDKQFFANVSNEAKLTKLYKLVDQTAAYYIADPVETQKEKAFLATLSGADLDGMAVAYEVAAGHVMVMTSDLQAQKAALEKNKDLRSFYNKHGTTDDQIDNDRSERQAPQVKSKPKR